MSYDIIAIDIDGTLTNDDKIITPKTKDALLLAQKKGKKVAIASGRHPQGVIPYAKELQLDKFGGYLLCFNGGLVLEITEKGCKTLYSGELPNEYIPVVCDVVRDSNITVNTHTENMIIADSKVNKYTSIEPDIIGLPFKQVDNFEEYVDFPVYKLLLAGEPAEIDEYEEKLKKRLDGLVSIYKSAPYFLEVMPLGVTKGASLHCILESMGLKSENLIACGDSYNDITMIGYAGLGVAMSNAPDDIKKTADYVTLSNNDDGIALVVEKFMLSDCKWIYRNIRNK